MWAMMQKFRICAGAVNVLSAKLLMGISWSAVLPIRGERGFAGTSSVSRQRRRDTIGHSRARPLASKLRYMASSRKSQWRTFQRFAEDLVVNKAPRFIRHVQTSQTVLRELQQAVKITADVI